MSQPLVWASWLLSLRRSPQGTFRRAGPRASTPSRPFAAIDYPSLPFRASFGWQATCIFNGVSGIALLAGLRGRRSAAWPTAVALAGLSLGAGRSVAPAGRHDKPETVSAARRMTDLRRAQVWSPTDVPSMNIRIGPTDPGAFPPDALVPCEYVDKPQK